MRVVVIFIKHAHSTTVCRKIIHNLPLGFVPSSGARNDDAGDLGVSDHVLADTAQQEAFDGTHAPRTHDDHVDFFLLGNVTDALAWVLV